LNQVVIPVSDELFVGLQVEARLGEKSPEERRMERLLRRTAREIYKLRKTRTNKGQLDVQSFRFGFYYLIRQRDGEYKYSRGPIIEEGRAASKSPH
jgi:hypothetical protein